MWYLKEIAYCLEAYFGYTADSAAEEIVISARLRGIAGGESEKILWRLLPIDWAHKVARDRDPNAPILDEDVVRKYQATRFRITAPRPE
jgi:hypothetical protein